MRKFATVATTMIIAIMMLVNVSASNGDNWGSDIFTTAAQQTTPNKETTTQKTTEKQSTTATISTTATSEHNTSSVTATTKKETTTIGKAAVRKLTNKQNKKISVKIKSVKNAAGYKINYSTSKKFKNAKSVSGKKLSYTLKNLKIKKIYYVKVRAYVLDNSSKKYGPWSSVKKIKISK